MYSINGSAGAGGSWPTDAECEDSRIIVQEQAVYCGCACALMVFELLGITTVPTQDELFEMGGAMPFSVDTLADVMNEVCSANKHTAAWIGRGVQPAPGRDYYDVIRNLTQRGPWIAHMRDYGERIGHFVVVYGEADNKVQCLDPAAPGTSYRMDFDTFLKHWNWQAVHLENL